MMRIAAVNQLLDRWIPPGLAEDPSRYERARMLVLLTGVMALASPFYAGLHLAYGVYLQAGAALVEGAAFLVLLTVFSRTGRRRLVGQAFVAVLYGALLGKLVLMGGYTLAGAGTLVWMLACPLLAAMLIGKRAALGWGLLVAGTQAAVFGIGILGYGFPTWIPAGRAPFIFFVDVIAFTGALTLLALLAASAKHRAERKLRAAKERAQQAARAKDALLMNMSHEIRTPLTSILGFADVLEEEGQCEHEFIGHIRSAGHRLLRTLNGVLDVAKLEAGDWDPDLEPVDLGEVIAQVGPVFEPKARESGLAWSVNRANGSVQARAEPESVRRIAQNLISNAIKFTEEGTVTVEIGQAGRPYLEVRDTGPGMSPVFQDRLTEAFAQESAGLNREHEGTGLGLTIVHKLTDLLGAELEIESQEGTGSRFRVYFQPVDPNGGPEPESRERPADKTYEQPA